METLGIANCFHCEEYSRHQSGGDYVWKVETLLAPAAHLEKPMSDESTQKSDDRSA